MRREIITWSAALVLLLSAFAGTVVILNSSLFSASGFVRSYLEAIQRHDADGALQLAGTEAAGDASSELLVADAMGELSDIQLLDDRTDDQGVHTITYSWTADGDAGESQFSVRRQGTSFGLFSTWAFDESPFGVVQVSVSNATAFTANGVDVVAAAPDQPAPYLVFAPGRYEFSHDSRFLHADPLAVTSSTPGAAVIAPVTVEPTEAFTTQVATELKDYLDACATQTVLLPTDCPFGQPISNRIDTTPQWSIARYPRVVLVRGSEPGTWLMPQTDAAAHLVVEIRSLFDGSVSTFDEDVPFTSSYVVTIVSDKDLIIAAQ